MTNISMIAVGLAMLAGIPLFVLLGRRVGQARAAGGGPPGGAAAITGAVFALLGLLVAFTFSGAAARFDQRRQLIIVEANAIGTAWLRLDLLPAEAQPTLRKQFREYVDLRISVYHKLPDIEAAFAELARADAMQRTIWTSALEAARATPGSPAPILLIPALNQMIDVTTTRTVMAQIHPPPVIYLLLCVLVLVSATFIGSEQAGKPGGHVLHTAAYTMIMALSIFVILNLEFPRLGFIGLDAADQVLADLRKTMN